MKWMRCWEDLNHLDVIAARALRGFVVLVLLLRCFTRAADVVHRKG